MTQKKYSLGIVQEDVLQYYAKQNERSVNGNRMKIITGMHNEIIYLLIPKGFTPVSQSSGIFSQIIEKISPTDPVPVSLDILAGQNVATWGGASVSAKALKYFTGVNFNVVDVPEGKRTNLNMPILLVGGQPYQPVEDYLKSGKYDLVGIEYARIKDRAPFYLELSANYTFGGKTYSVPTIGVRALLLGKAFRKESRNVNMLALTQCISENLADLADDPDTNPNWQTVYDLEGEGSQTNWEYFPLQ